MLGRHLGQTLATFLRVPPGLRAPARRSFWGVGVGGACGAFSPTPTPSTCFRKRKQGGWITNGGQGEKGRVGQ